MIIALLFSCVIAADAASYLLGDVNGDGDVDVIDATIVQRYDARFPVPYDETQLMRGDVDGDGEVTILDATLIQRYATQVSTPYDIGGRVNEIVDLYLLGTLNNYGRYDDVIDSQDPDKGNISYHRGIQLTWKDDVTVLDEATDTYTVNPDVIPGTLFIGMDADGNKSASAAVNNYGDIVMVPGILNIYAGFNNLAGGEVIYAGRLYVCAVTEAVVPITPDPNDPTKTEERRPLAEPYPSVINKDADAVVNNEGMVAEASVKVSSNGVLGELTVGQEIEI